MPREVATFVSDHDAEESALRSGPSGSDPCSATPPAAAYIPHNYIPEAAQRVEAYRKLALVRDKPELDRLEAELRDRFGVLPPAVERLLQVAELKLLAAARNITAIEVEEEKLKLTRNGDLLLVGGKFPRLTKREALARLKEIRRMLLAL